MDSKEYIKEVLKTIEDAVEQINKAVPRLQSKMYDRVLELTKELNTVGKNVKADTENLRLLSKIRMELERIIDDPEFKHAIREFKSAFDKVEQINKVYFTSIAETRGVPAVLNELKQQVIKDVDVKLGSGRVSQLVTDKAHEILRVSITSGSTYASMVKSVQTFLEKNGATNEFARYAKQITTDSINQYNAQYNKIFSEDLDLSWFQYVGSLLETSREFCVELVDQRYVHVSEIPELLKGHVNGKHIPVSDKTGLPYGMIDGTDKYNFQVRRGGWNCAHQLIAVSSATVPEHIKAKFK